MIIGVKRWALLVGAGMMAAAGLGTAVARWQPRPRECVEHAGLLDSSGSWHCAPPSRLTVEHVGTYGDKLLARCVCPGSAPTPPPPDAGASGRAPFPFFTSGSLTIDGPPSTTSGALNIVRSCDVLTADGTCVSLWKGSPVVDAESAARAGGTGR